MPTNYVFRAGFLAGLFFACYLALFSFIVSSCQEEITPVYQSGTIRVTSAHDVLITINGVTLTFYPHHEPYIEFYNVEFGNVKYVATVNGRSVIGVIKHRSKVSVLTL